MINPSYAAWRAECCKADIEMGLLGYDPPPECTPEEREARRKAYHREYDRRYRAKKKATRLLAQQSGTKKIRSSVL